MTIKESQELLELSAYVGLPWRTLRQQIITRMEEDRVLYSDDNLEGWNMSQVFAEEGIPLTAAAKIYIGNNTIRACLLFAKLELTSL